MYLYNTLKRKKELFKPIENGRVGMYTCGVTVYFYPHIGNWRTYIMEDLLKRALIMNGYEPHHIMNITDVGHLTSDADSGEDKLRVAAKREHKSVKMIADFYAEEFERDMRRLNMIMPDTMCRASGHIGEILALIDRLDKKGFLYTLGDGVYFDTSKFKKYGALIGMTFGQLNKSLKAGARVDRPDGLRNITDFAVWRFAKDEKEMVWDSKYGRGFPGWHIECSAMSMRYLGNHFDLHCGGVDHINVHHTNEIAQSEAATGKKFVNYWWHGAFLKVNNTKMSKSLGNIYTLEDLFGKGYTPMELRYFMLGGHYRQELNFTMESLESAANSLRKVYNIAVKLAEFSRGNREATKGTKKAVTNLELEFFNAIDDDLDTPTALTKFHAVMNEANRRVGDGSITAGDAAFMLEAIIRMDSVLGLMIHESIKQKEQLPKGAMRLIKEREKLRKAKKFKEADEARKVLKDRYNVILEDTKEGVRWQRLE